MPRVCCLVLMLEPESLPMLANLDGKPDKSFSKADVVAPGITLNSLEVVRMDPPLPIEVESSSILDILRRLLLLLVALLLDALPLLELDDVSNTLLKLLL